MQRLTYLSVAEVELIEAARYYAERREVLGKMSLDAVCETEKRIQTNPETWPVYQGAVRACRVKPFPYRLLHRALPDRLQIVAVAHLSREPGYEMDRIS